MDMNKPWRSIGLRHASPSDIKELARRHSINGYQVVHKTEGLPFNGVLICKKRVKL